MDKCGAKSSKSLVYSSKFNVIGCSIWVLLISIRHQLGKLIGVRLLLNTRRMICVTVKEMWLCTISAIRWPWHCGMSLWHITERDFNSYYYETIKL